ncbi:spindle and centriole-associated protein 1 isoform X2 [Archocentrus centrarchus]|uniref:spindle and centriole-associated protein 1 isoform X2 n=1 Tax=Archocentrus centrarchus TaxID=63155 RepID=UPI0011E9B933|nr:spindle and centriole-associated protein 1 isoform X2 [Archocentrus centrarchus]
MSFMRVGRPQQHTKGKRPARPKKAAAQRKEWVSTVNDLSVHKLTPAELSHRHEIHKSHNKAAAQWELKERALKRRLRHSGSPAPLDQASLSIIREVFSDQLLLQDVLSRSDRALAVVKDLFGDAPRRHTGHPSVTVAPNCDSDTELPVLQRPDPPTHLSLLSQSMMDQEALNELEAAEEDQRDDVHPSGSSEYHIIRRANIQKMKAQSWAKVAQQRKGYHHNRHQGDKDNTLVTPSTSDRAPDQMALNATVAVQRVRSKQSQSEEDKEETSVLVSQVLNPELNQSKSGLRSRTNRARKCVSQGSDLDGSSVASLSRDQSSLGLLQAMLGQVESDLDALSPDTAPPSAQSPKWHRTQGLTGFSVALVSTLGRLVHLLKQREDEAQNEAQERRKLEEELKEQRGLIDALTAESMTLREEAAALQAGLQQRTADLEQKLDTVVLAMGGLGLLGERSSPPPHSECKAAGCQSVTGAERVPEQTLASVSPAVLLSPPRQQDNWQHVPVTHPVLPHQQLPSVDSLSSYGDLQAHSSDSNSLPLTKLPSTSSLSLTSDPLRSPLSPGTLLAEIAQLSRETDLIRAQLSQPKGLGSGVREPLDSGNERRRSSCSSAGKVTPQSVGERRMSESSCKERRSQHVQTPGEEQLTQQATSPNALSTNSVEQRLLELNRQSAAARGRLLEIIEQQKQSISVRVSPSVSPIPASAFSPDAAYAGGESLEASVLLPEWELRSRGGGGGSEGERRFAGSVVASHSFGRGTKDGKTQMDKERKREGWFALSAHVR